MSCADLFCFFRWQSLHILRANGRKSVARLECGIDVVTVDSLAFQRYCELASLICKHLTIVTDNDGNVSAVINRYKKFGDLVTLCVEQDDSLISIESQIEFCKYELRGGNYKDYKDGPVKIGLNQKHPTARGTLV